MEWVKQCKLPPTEAITRRNGPCNKLEDLWESLHSTYNSAKDREINLEPLDQLETHPERPWLDFSSAELMDVLGTCSSSSAPEPDHITWAQWKVICSNPVVTRLLVKLANACLKTGCWRKHFKESNSVIIPKLNNWENCSRK